MSFNFIKKYITILFFASFFLSSISFSSEYSDIIKKVFSDRKLDNIEGIWVKTLANQGPPGCVTMFYKGENDLFYQIHIDSCFVTGKITGRQSKLTEITYNGENAVYFYNGNINWESSSIKISENLNLLSITHGSYDFSFKEEWKRLWPNNVKEYNSSLGDK